MNCYQCSDKQNEVSGEDCSLAEKIGARLLAGVILAGLGLLLVTALSA